MSSVAYATPTIPTAPPAATPPPPMHPLFSPSTDRSALRQLPAYNHFSSSSPSSTHAYVPAHLATTTPPSTTTGATTFHNTPSTPSSTPDNHPQRHHHHNVQPLHHQHHQQQQQQHPYSPSSYSPKHQSPTLSLHHQRHQQQQRQQQHHHHSQLHQHQKPLHHLSPSSLSHPISSVTSPGGAVGAVPTNPSPSATTKPPRPARRVRSESDRKKHAGWRRCPRCHRSVSTNGRNFYHHMRKCDPIFFAGLLAQVDFTRTPSALPLHSIYTLPPPSAPHPLPPLAPAQHYLPQQQQQQLQQKQRPQSPQSSHPTHVQQHVTNNSGHLSTGHHQRGNPSPPPSAPSLPHTSAIRTHSRPLQCTSAPLTPHASPILHPVSLSHSHPLSSPQEPHRRTPISAPAPQHTAVPHSLHHEQQQQPQQPQHPHHQDKHQPHSPPRPQHVTPQISHQQPLSTSTPPSSQQRVTLSPHQRATFHQQLSFLRVHNRRVDAVCNSLQQTSGSPSAPTLLPCSALFAALRRDSEAAEAPRDGEESSRATGSLSGLHENCDSSAASPRPTAANDDKTTGDVATATTTTTGATEAAMMSKPEQGVNALGSRSAGGTGTTTAKTAGGTTTDTTGNQQYVQERRGEKRSHADMAGGEVEDMLRPTRKAATLPPLSAALPRKGGSWSAPSRPLSPSLPTSKLAPLGQVAGEGKPGETTPMEREPGNTGGTASASTVVTGTPGTSPQTSPPVIRKASAMAISSVID